MFSDSFFSYLVFQTELLGVDQSFHLFYFAMAEHLSDCILGHIFTKIFVKSLTL